MGNQPEVGTTMRSSTRKVAWPRVPLLVMGLTLAACTAQSAEAAAVEDRSADAAEKHRAAIFMVENHRYDAIERLKGSAF
jgi:hypothetical protein